ELEAADGSPRTSRMRSSSAAPATTASSLCWLAVLIDRAAPMPSASSASSPTARITIATSTSMRLKPSSPTPGRTRSVDTVYPPHRGHEQRIGDPAAHGGDDGAAPGVADQSARVEGQHSVGGGRADHHAWIIGAEV